jgi:UPF0176 protein
MSAVKPILNISAYKFVTLCDAAALRESIRSQAQGLALMGTVLLAEEGINLFIAGAREAVLTFVAWLREDALFADLAPKASESDTVPFGKLLVKIKTEIIRMNRPLIRPQTQRAASIDPTTLARWLDDGVDDDGRPVLMLDTRNAFEVDHGRFRGALDWRIARFGDFPQALADHADALRGNTVVSYCTGGIRCEKAALLMQQGGIERVLQLDGGILNYFEQVGGTHFEGNCFVFDQRESLNARLLPAGSADSPATCGADA